MPSLLSRSSATLRSFLIAPALVSIALAQAGDRGGEVQTPRVPEELIPPAPALSAEEALKTFKVPAGYKVEIVASDPLISSPVAVQFGPDGRLWVLEMRGFMPNEKGEGEEAPVGRVSVLEDTNGDGRMDKGTVFLDKLIMPRAFMLVRDGLLLAEPPVLWFHRDSNGDGIADQKTLISDAYGVEANALLGTRANIEHAANSLVWTMDNWIHSANYATRFRNVTGAWEKGATVSRGQWGLSQDDYGRLFYNSNSDQLRVDLVPAEYLSRNPNYPGALGANYRAAASQVTWPGRVNPGVNRGYQPNTLRPDGTLASFTGACGPMIYRGDLFPVDFRGNAFVCEPTGNFVRRNILTEKDGIITAENAYNQTEFMVSTDERFRPVNLATGPDGAIYVVDMYRGIIQHRVFVTTYLLNQSLSRGLQSPTDLGRIYRIVPDGTPAQPAVRPNLATATSAQLAATLSHPNGWWRDNAQRILVERSDLSVLPELRRIAASAPSPLARIHALWTLDGLGRTDKAAVLAGMQAPEAKVRVAAVRTSEPLLGTPAGTEVLAAMLRLTRDPELEVQRQVALSLGEAPDPLTGLATILLQNRENQMVRDAAFSSLRGRELELIERLVQDSAWAMRNNPTEQVFAVLARAVMLEGKADRIGRLLDLVVKQTGSSAWRQLALLDGMAGQVGGSTPPTAPAAAAAANAPARGPAAASASIAPSPAPAAARGPAANPPAQGAAVAAGEAAPAAAPAGRGGRGNQGQGGRGGRGGGRGGAASAPKRLPAEPAALAVLRQQPSEDLARRVAAVEALLLWPGKPGVVEAVVTPLTAEEQVLFQSGRETYTTTCGACHQPDGNGRDGIAPPLVNSEWVTGSDSRLIRIVLHGVRGPISVNGRTYQGDMPPLGALTDTQLAGLLTYIRREWGHTAGAVAPSRVTGIRNETAGRSGAWTEVELNGLP